MRNKALIKELLPMRVIWVMAVFLGSLFLSFVVFPLFAEDEESIFLSPLLSWGLLSLFTIAAAIWQGLRLKKDYLKAKLLLEETEEESLLKESHVALEANKQQIEGAFSKALKTLDKSGLSGQKIYSFPWFIILGPPGSGKTASLNHSGEIFHHEKSEISFNLGGTRNFDWWFSDKCLFIDSAGRYTSQDGHMVIDKHSWQYFIGLLKRVRARRPLDGILVSYSVEDLLALSDAKRKLYAKALRERVKELQANLKVNLPIYFVLTKMDLLEGFAESFSDLEGEEMSQLWGFEFDHANEGEAPLATNWEDEFSPKFAELLKTLQNRVNYLLAGGKELVKKQRVFLFTQHMAAIEKDVKRFISECFANNRFETGFEPRGVFFTSSMQDSESGAKSQSYFSGKLFQEYLPRQTAFAPTKVLVAENLGKNAKKWMILAGAAAVLLATVMATKYGLLRSDIKRYETRVHEAHVFQNWAQAPDESESLLDVLESYSVSDGYRRVLKFVPFRYPSERSLQSRTLEKYEQKLHSEFGDYLVKLVEGFLSKSMASADHAMTYRLTQVYWSLLKDIPEREKTVRKWYSSFLDENFPLEEQSFIQDRLKRHLENYLSLEHKAPNYRQDIAASIQKSLGPLASLQELYLKFKSMYEDTLEPLVILDSFSDKGRLAFRLRPEAKKGSLIIPGLFTAAGYKDVFLAKVDGFIDENNENSLLFSAKEPAKGEKKDDKKDEKKPEAKGKKAQDKSMVLAELEKLYFDEYKSQWEHAIEAIEFAPQGSSQGFLELLILLKGEASPFHAFLSLVKTHTVLAGPADKLLDMAAKGIEKKAGDKAGKVGAIVADVKSKFRSSGRDGLREHFKRFHEFGLKDDGSEALDYGQMKKIIEGLEGRFSKIEGASDQGESAEKAVLELAGEESSELSRLRLLADRQSPQLARLLRQIAEKSEVTLIGQASKFVKLEWNHQISDVFSRQIKPHFPVSRATSEIAMGDFGKFFGYGGVVDEFFQKHLKALVNQRVHPWRWKSSLGYSKSMLAFFENAEQVRRGFFKPGSQEISGRFTFEADSLSPQFTVASLFAGPDSLIYRHGPKLQTSFAWPSKGARLVCHDKDKGDISLFDESGEWSLLRMILMAKLSPSGTGQYTVELLHNGANVSYKLKLESSENPVSAFMALRSLEAPEHI